MCVRVTRVFLALRNSRHQAFPDVRAIPGQLEAWHTAVSAWFDQIIANDDAAFGNLPLQCYNAATLDPGGIAVEQAITWNAFPKELIRRYGRFRICPLSMFSSLRVKSRPNLMEVKD